MLFRSEHHEVTLSPAEALAVIEQLPQLIDEPLGDSSFIPTYVVSRLARQHVKVVLSGDGGDELFGGYSTLQAHRIAGALAAVPPALWRPLGRLAARLPTSMANISADFKLKRFLKGMPYPPALRHHVWLGSAAPEEARALLAPGLSEAIGDPDPHAAVRRHLAACPAADPLNRILYLDLKLYLEGDILPKVDRASMACGLETRAPLLNPRLLALAARLPINLKLRGLSRRWAFRQAVQGLLPPAILRRPKKGFNMPVAQWLRGPLRPLLSDVLSPSRLRAQGLFNPKTVDRLCQAHLAGRADHRKILWTLLVFQLWHQRHIARPGPHALPEAALTHGRGPWPL